MSNKPPTSSAPAYTEPVRPNSKKPTPRKIAVDPGYLRPKDAASYLGFPTETLKKWRFRKKGPPYIKISRNLVVYKISDLDDWLVRRKELASFDLTAKMLGLEE